MVRNIALGILIAAVTPNNLANSTALIIDNKQQTVDAARPPLEASLNLPCVHNNLASDLPCISEQKSKNSLWMQKVTNLLLPPLVADCGEPSGWASIQDSLMLQGNSLQETPMLADNSRKQYTFLLPKQAIASKCLTRSQHFNFARQEPIARIVPSQGLASSGSLPKPQPITQFPKLSRSSLIVNFPQEHSSLVLKDTKFVNPASETERIASPFGWRRRPYSHQLQFHQGIDYGAPYGSPVVAVGNGIVTKVVSGCADFGNLFCGNQLGNWIEIDHGNGAIGTYGHLKSSSIAVEPGMKVRKNQNIAQVGSSGWSTGAHLDFRLKVNGKYEDPDLYVMTSDR